MMDSCKLFLALGDSYTIGEQVMLQENFPYQLVRKLRRLNHAFAAPEIIAKTGWTTGELLAAIGGSELLPAYDLVTLLIGVNNQYRGLSIENYAQEFRTLLNKAVQFAGNNPGKVFVLSIPDWSVTPFASDRNRHAIALEIDAYNSINKSIASGYGVHYTDITPGTREAATQADLLAADGLHPSSVEYARWAVRIAEIIGSRE